MQKLVRDDYGAYEFSLSVLFVEAINVSAINVCSINYYAVFDE